MTSEAEGRTGASGGGRPPSSADPTPSERGGRRKLLRRTVIALIALALCSNVVACFHARAMVTWSEEGARTPGLEELGPLDKARVLLTGIRVPRPVDSRTPDAVELPFEEHRFASSNGATLETWFIPAGGARGPRGTEPWVACVFPGYAASKSTMLDVGRELHGLDLDVLLVDFYGVGGSSGTGTSIGVHEAHDVLAALEWCRDRDPNRRVLLYGRSMGGAAILRSVAHLGASPDAIAMESTFDSLMTTVEHRFEAMGLPGQPLASLLLLWGGREAGIHASDHLPARDAAWVRCPALVLHGTHDPRVTLTEAETLRSGLGGWNELVEFPGAGHEPLPRVDLERWRGGIRQLLAAR